MAEDLEQRIHDAIANPKNVGEMENADAIGTVGSADCGDMLRMWVKFTTDEKGRKIIDRATFQTFGCETALAVASVATELIAGKTVDEALTMSGSDLSAPLGPLPPPSLGVRRRRTSKGHPEEQCVAPSRQMVMRNGEARQCLSMKRSS